MLYFLSSNVSFYDDYLLISTDIDECTSPKRNRCPKNTLCINTPGGYHCDSNNVRHMLAKQLSIGIV